MGSSALKLHHRQRKSRCMVSPEQISDMADAVFWSNPDRPGWVECYVNDKGRSAVNALFPKAHIEWVPIDTDPKIPAASVYKGRGWYGFEMHLPSVAEQAGPNNLWKLPEGLALDDCSPDQLSFVLAISVKYQGARGMIRHGDGTLQNFQPQEN